MNLNLFNPFQETQKYEKQQRKELLEAANRRRYGKFNGYWQWDLACTWFRVTNDDFFRIYGFNFVPKGKLYEEAREFVWN